MNEARETMALVPKLRFPEFANHGAPIVELRKIAKCVSDSVPLSQVNPASYVSTESLLAEFGGFERPAGLPTVTSVRSFRRNDVLVSNIRPYLKKVWYADRDGGASNDVLVFRANEAASPDYLAQVIRSERFIGHMMKSARGVKMPRGDADDALTFKVMCPSDAEQRKIAECLQSLDELIAAETEKLEALKRHKKGLLQQLFPAEGETTPRLRFPQFRVSDNWIYRTLDELAENLDNRRVPISSSERIYGEIPYYGASGIVDYVEGYIFDEKLLCVSEDGANLVARSTPIAFTIEGRTWVNNHAHVLKFTDGHTHSLVEAYLNEMDLSDYLTGMAQPKLNRGMLDTIAIPLPSSQEEAESVAELIITVSRGLVQAVKRLEALKQHKDALMQQLFPSTEETADAENQ